jgi:hypothetical protein
MAGTDASRVALGTVPGTVQEVVRKATFDSIRTATLAGTRRGFRGASWGRTCGAIVAAICRARRSVTRNGIVGAICRVTLSAVCGGTVAVNLLGNWDVTEPRKRGQSLGARGRAVQSPFSRATLTTPLQEGKRGEE